MPTPFQVWFTLLVLPSHLGWLRPRPTLGRGQDSSGGGYSVGWSLPWDYKVVMSPPSMTKSEPVTLPARSLATSTMRSSTSSGRVNHPVTASVAACLATSSASVPLVRATVASTLSSPSHSWVDTGPGLAVLTRAPRGPTCLGSDLEKFSKAALAALQSMTSGFGRTAMTEQVLMMVPAPRSSKYGSAARVVRTASRKKPRFLLERRDARGYGVPSYLCFG